MGLDPIVRVRGLYKSFVRGSEEIKVLADLNLDVAEGEFLALMGPSGSGKTTLLNLIAGLQQRVGSARAIVTDPTLIVADEPTGDLDSKSAQEILDLLCVLREHLNKTILMVTHDPHAAERAQRELHLEKGRLVDEVQKA